MTLEQIAERIDGLSDKMDAIIAPVKEDVSELKKKVDSHGDKLTALESFKEGHQREHEDGVSRRRFNWEILAASGVIGGFIKWVAG